MTAFLSSGSIEATVSPRKTGKFDKLFFYQNEVENRNKSSYKGMTASLFEFKNYKSSINLILNENNSMKFQSRELILGGDC